MRRVAAIAISYCPQCKTGRWMVIACMLPQRTALTEGTEVAQVGQVASGPLSAVACRGPP